MNTDFSFHISIPIFIFCLILWTLMLNFKNYKKDVKHSYLLAIITSRLLAVIACFLFFMQFYTIIKKPDTKQFSIAILADTSGSMLNNDCEQKSRFEVLKTLLSNTHTSFINQLERQYNISLYNFSDNILLKQNKNIKKMPGKTAIGFALKELSERTTTDSLGAVILLSDGLENTGIKATELAKNYRKSGIPISTIGIGGNTKMPDISVHFIKTTKKIPKNTPFDLTVKVKSSIKKSITKKIILSNRFKVIAEKNVELNADEPEKTVHFTLNEFTPGFKNYRVEIPFTPPETLQSNNIDYTGLKITEDENFTILYYSSILGWEYKFLKRLCEDNPKLHLTGLIRTGKKTWYYTNKKKDFERFPNAESLHKFDLIIFDMSATNLLTPEIFNNLTNFVSEKGGGLLITGFTDEGFAQFKNILPIKNIFLEPSFPQHIIQLSKKSFLIPKTNDDIFNLKKILTTPDGQNLIYSTKLKTGAKNDLFLKSNSSKKTLMATQHYGLGRTAYLGIETWKWRLSRLSEGKHYNVFWERLIRWLSEASQDQMNIFNEYKKYPIGQKTLLKIDLLNNFFQPSTNAIVQTELTQPNGHKTELNLFIDSEIEGRFQNSFIPTETGEYQLKITAKFPRGKSITKETAFLVIDKSHEKNNKPLNSTYLKDISRITGGKYTYYKQPITPNNLPISKNIPMISTKKYLFNNWTTLLFILFFFCLEWFLRRRIGMK